MSEMSDHELIDKGELLNEIRIYHCGDKPMKNRLAIFAKIILEHMGDPDIQEAVNLMGTA